ncbi:MAG TPA: ABC transporter permease [Acidimicrobiales bacterium]|nr:ABC transporter permease [Acidimicrobiales bacterium]
MTLPDLRKSLVIGAVNGRRFLRERANLFYVFIMPIGIIIVIGLQFGDETSRLGVAGGTDGAFASAVLDHLGDSDLELVTVDADDVQDRVDSADIDAGVVFPTELDATIDGRGVAEVRFVAGDSVTGQRLRQEVAAAIRRASAPVVAARAAVDAGAEERAAADAAARLADEVDAIEVRRETAGERLFPEGTEGLDVAAPNQLVLFVFITGLTGAFALIQTRQLGISARMRSTPTSMSTIILGEAIGRFFIGLVQGAYILVATLVVFGVDWGDPLAAVAVVLALAAVSAGAAMCFGTFFSEPEQASGLGVLVALALAAIGGAMLPIELFSDTLATVARFTPHYWAIDAFAELLRHDGTLADIGRQLGVLVLFATGLLALASWRLRAVLLR